MEGAVWAAGRKEFRAEGTASTKALRQEKARRGWYGCGRGEAEAGTVEPESHAGA